MYSKRRKFDLAFTNKEISIVENKIGSSFLPPINKCSKRQMNLIPHLKQHERKNSASIEKHLPNQPPMEKISALDPKNLSMPGYSCSYNNEKNAAAFRHLLGGRKDGLGAAVNNHDLNNSVVHWQLDLRYYNP
jgi:hypothetical protein